jgi:hypothetical protein
MKLPIAGFPGYEISDTGEVFGPRGKLRGEISRGYLRVTLYNNRQPSRRLVASLVMDAFVGPKPSGHDIDHINGIRLDNSIGNLRYLGSRENRGRWTKERRDAVIKSIKEANTIYSDDVVLAAMWSVLRLGKSKALTARLMGLSRTDLSVWCSGKRRPHLLSKVV